MTEWRIYFEWPDGHLDRLTSRSLTITMSAGAELARQLDVPANRVTQILNGTCAIKMQRNLCTADRVGAQCNPGELSECKVK